uniref:Putative defensin 1 n=1 Tax=Lutzomyia longipalpis TaxID=7200 RepID=A0A1B0EZB6_LUTLO
MAKAVRIHHITWPEKKEKTEKGFDGGKLMWLTWECVHEGENCHTHRLVMATPVQEISDNSNQVLEPEEIPEAPELSIEPRVTCDLLGPTGWGDALCAAHCIALGHKGGCKTQ